MILLLVPIPERHSGTPTLWSLKLQYPKIPLLFNNRIIKLSFSLKGIQSYKHRSLSKQTDHFQTHHYQF